MLKKPLISADKSLEELTPRAILIGSFLALTLGAATTYLALRVGVTVSASIPSIAICLAIFKILRPSNVLEVNIVQTIASAGYVVGSVAAFMLPGLVMVGFWKSFDYMESFLPLIVGSTLGVLMSVPLRKYYFENLHLRYPEGVAAGTLLEKVIHNQDSKEQKKGKGLFFGAGVGGVLQFLQEGLRIIPSSVSGWTSVGSVPLGLTVGVTPSLIGVGYIIGARAGFTVFIATVLAMFVGVPILGGMFDASIDPTNIEGSAMGIWAKHVRFIGVGIMLMGGLELCFKLIKPLMKSMQIAMQAAKTLTANKEEVLRTEKDLNIRTVIRGSVLLLALAAFGLYIPLAPVAPHLIYGLIPTMAIIITAFVVMSAVSASIGGYMAGVVGSSYNPLSGVSIINVCMFSAVLSLLVDTSSLCSQTSLTAIVLFLITYAGGVCSISCDNIQDLKAGQMVGSTPWKQQVGLVIGAVCGALIVPYILQILLEAYGIGNYHPNAIGEVDPTKTLQAPKAALLSSLAKMIFAGDLDWLQIKIGLGIGLLVIAYNMMVQSAGKRAIDMLSVGVGVYMPFEITAPMFLGGFLSYLASRKNKTASEQVVLASGLVAGEAIIGVLVAGLMVSSPSFGEWRSTAGAILNPTLALAMSWGSLLLMGSLLYRHGTKMNK
ncbi:MAG: oligopeptide transporter, OPT family [Alphaproteobacteria bacterium]|nr:oligopeptide transporter, OPT family [Alphaproteobacteria bacterium]